MVKRADLASSRIVWFLFVVRGLPSRRFTISDMVTFGFVVLADLPAEELVLGLVGRPWRIRGGLERMTPATYAEFDRPGNAKMAANFRVDATPDGTLLSTETRVLCTDDASRHAFGRYWRIVGPFSGLIRRRWLATIKRQAERQL